MTPEEIRALAIECGAITRSWVDTVSFLTPELAVYTAIVEANMRERYAKECEEVGELMAQRYGDGAECLTTSEACVEAIRSLK